MSTRCACSHCLFAVVVTSLEQRVNNLKHKGRTIRTVIGGGGGGGKSKNKNRAGETENKKIRAPEKFEKKNSCRDFSIGKIIS